MKADPAKVDAVLSMERLTDVSGVEDIMGTVGYLAKFLPRLSEVSSLSDSLPKGIQNSSGTKFMTEHLVGSRRW